MQIPIIVSQWQQDIFLGKQSVLLELENSFKNSYDFFLSSEWKRFKEKYDLK